MGGYIGATAVGLTTTAADVQGDITSTDTTPELILKNTSEEDTEGGREGKITFKGEQSGGEESTLAQIQSSHDGTSDDQKGDLIFKTNDGSDGASPTERMRIDSTGATTITTTGNETQLTLTSTDADATTGPNMSFYRNSASPDDDDQTGSIFFIGKDDGGNDTTYGAITTHIADASGGTEDGRLTLSSMKAGTSTETLHVVSGQVGVNTSSPLSTFQIRDSGSENGSLRVGGSGASLGLELLYDQSGATTSTIQANPTYTSTTSLMKIRVDGDLNTNQLVLKGDGIVGIGREPSSSTGSVLQTEGSDGIAFRRPSQTNSFTIRPLSSGDGMRFTQEGTGDLGAWDSGGSLVISETSASNVGNGSHAYIGSNGQLYVSSTSSHFMNKTADGSVLVFRSAGSNEGSVSISGSTTSFNGGHLSRWSRLTSGNRDASILKGTVMTNLDEMVAWSHPAIAEGDEIKDNMGNTIAATSDHVRDAYTEDNEQLNCMAVSSVEGDPNVAGVFVNWDNDDDFNDMNVAMTGDMVIRIGKGVTIARGDLLMSAGDGTAKPQGDDIVRSKTIAKVTSTNVSHTYDDESYLVPCVLMAC
jgi:hypothetical protein